MSDDTKRLRVTLVYEYLVQPEHYPDPTPLAIAETDIEQDVVSIILDANLLTVEDAVFV